MTKWKASINYNDGSPPAEFEFTTDDTAAGFDDFSQWLSIPVTHDWTTVENIVITPQEVVAVK